VLLGLAATRPDGITVGRTWIPQAWSKAIAARGTAEMIRQPRGIQQCARRDGKTPRDQTKSDR
jgi:hypothetical protein